MTEARGYRMLSLGEESGVSVEGGALDWVSAGGQVIEDHVESPGQEELYVGGRGPNDADRRRGAG